MGETTPLVIWGAGAIGGTVGAFLARAGHPVILVDKVAEHVRALNEVGLKITGPVDAFTVPVRAVLPADLSGTYDRFLLCVKSQDTAAAISELLPHLAHDGYVASFQNGLNEPDIAGMVGASRTMGSFINYASDYISPGVIHYGGPGAVVVGEIDGSLTKRASALHEMLKDFERDAVLTDNIFGFLWSKQAYAILLKASSLTNATIVEVLESQEYRATLAALSKEIVRAALANGIKLESFDAFFPEAFMPGSSPAAEADCFLAMIAYNAKSEKARSGIWRDIAVRKRRTEVVPQLTPVIRLGREHGEPMTLVARLVELFNEVEDGLRPLGWENLDLLRQTYESADGRAAGGTIR